MVRRRTSLFAAVSLTLAPMLVAAAQSTVTVSPFMSYVPSAATNPLAGFSLTFGGTTGLALRGGAELSVSNPDSAARAVGGNRPWGADADIMLYLGGLGGGATVFSRSLSPYVFSGIGLMGTTDSLGKDEVQDGWSYGLGTTLPLGMDADLFGEARWRMSKYVLPTADDAPDSKSEFRFGLSFHVGRGSNIAPPPRREPRRRQRLYNDDDDPEYEPAPQPTVVAPVVVPPVIVQQAPAPQPQVVVVQQPAPQVVVVQQPAPEPPRRERAVNINIPVILFPQRRERQTTVIVTGSECSRRRGRTYCSNDNRYNVPITTTSSNNTVVQVASPSVATPSGGKAKRPSRRPE